MYFTMLLVIFFAKYRCFSIWMGDPDLQIVVDPGNLVPRKNFSFKKVLRKINVLFVENNCCKACDGFQFLKNFL